MALSQKHQVKIQNRILHIMTYQVMRMSQYQQSTVQNQSTNANHNIAKCNNEVNNDECDMLNDNIENQMNAPTREMVNDDGE